MCVNVCLYIYLSIYRSIDGSIDVSVYRSIYPSIYLSISASVCLSIYLYTIYLYIYIYRPCIHMCIPISYTYTARHKALQCWPPFAQDCAHRACGRLEGQERQVQKSEAWPQTSGTGGKLSLRVYPNSMYISLRGERLGMLGFASFVKF